jgi:nucleoside-diphosphate-sugar epimerase
MKVLLTGATGFIGSRVAYALAGLGAEVFAVVRGRGRANQKLPSNIQLVEGELRPGGMNEAVRVGAEICIHAAWIAEPGKYLTSPLNIDLVHATAHLARDLARAGCRRFVGVGTCFEYDTNAGYLSEGTPLAPGHVYSAAKVSTYHLVRQVLAGTGTAFAWARIFYAFGPNEHPNRLVPTIIDRLHQNEAALITPGAQIRDFLHVDDVASALAAIALGDVDGAINIGSGEPITVATMAKTIGDIMGRPELIQLGAKPYSPGDPMFICADVRKLRSIGWAPAMSLHDGLIQTIRARTTGSGGVP